MSFQKKEGLNIYGARVFRVNTVMSRMRLLKKEQVYHCFFFFFFFFLGGGGGGGVGGGGIVFPRSGFI